MLHDDRMALLESCIGQKPESQPFIEGDGNQFVADPDADVIDLRYIKHWLDIAMGMSLLVAVDYIRWLEVGPGSGGTGHPVAPGHSAAGTSLKR